MNLSLTLKSFLIPFVIFPSSPFLLPSVIPCDNWGQALNLITDVSFSN